MDLFSLKRYFLNLTIQRIVLLCLVCFLVFPRVLSEKEEVTGNDGKNATGSENAGKNRSGSPMASELVGLSHNDSIEGNSTNAVKDTKGVESNIEAVEKPLIIEINLKKPENDDVNIIKVIYT